MRNKGIFTGNATSTKRQSGQKAGNTPPEDQSQPPAGPEASKPCQPLDQWARPPPQRESHNGSPATLKNQIYLKFCPFWSPKFPRKHQAPPKNHLLLPLFTENSPCLSENLPRWRRKGRRKGAAGEQPGSIQKGTPPHPGSGKKV